MAAIDPKRSLNKPPGVIAAFLVGPSGRQRFPDEGDVNVEDN